MTNAVAFIDDRDDERMFVPFFRQDSLSECRNLPSAAIRQNQASGMARPASRMAPRQSGAVRISTDTQPLYSARRNAAARGAYAAAWSATGIRCGALAWQCTASGAAWTRNS